MSFVACTLPSYLHRSYTVVYFHELGTALELQAMSCMNQKQQRFIIMDPKKDANYTHPNERYDFVFTTTIITRGAHWKVLTFTLLICSLLIFFSIDRQDQVNVRDTHHLHISICHLTIRHNRQIVQNSVDSEIAWSWVALEERKSCRMRGPNP